MSEQQHRAWVQAAKQGDEYAFTCLVKAYQDKIYSLAYYVTQNHQDAEDVTQEVFLKLWRSMDSYREDASVQAWIMQIAKHACFDLLRKRKRTATESLYTERDGEQVERPLADPDGQSNPAEVVAEQDRRQSVERALLALPPEYREVLTLRYINGLSYEQITQVLGQPEGTVKSRLFRAKKSLKNILENGNFF